jgi:exodeoxyribonuclease VII small subunit
MKKQENQNKTLEASFEELQEIIKKLEKDDISLEDSFSLYTEGIELLKYCNNSIDKVEKQLIVLGENKESDELS